MLAVVRGIPKRLLIILLPCRVAAPATLRVSVIKHRFSRRFTQGSGMATSRMKAQVMWILIASMK
jgi:hypothetical protein